MVGDSFPCCLLLLLRQLAGQRGSLHAGEEADGTSAKAMLLASPGGLMSAFERLRPGWMGETKIEWLCESCAESNTLMAR